MNGDYNGRGLVLFIGECLKRLAWFTIVTGINGFTGNITETESVSPSGPTVSLSPAILQLKWPDKRQLDCYDKHDDNRPVWRLHCDGKWDEWLAIALCKPNADCNPVSGGSGGPTHPDLPILTAGY